MDHVRSVLELLDDLLDLSRTDAGRAVFRLQAVEPGALARQVREVFALRAAEKGIPLVVDEPAACPPVLADTIALKEVLHNLVSNALKFTPPLSPDRPVVLRLRPGVLEVEDRGPGFTTEDLARAFTPFTRLSARPTGGESSTGLGLAIVRGRVDAMGGTLTLESAPGEGARFRVTLPMADLSR